MDVGTRLLAAALARVVETDDGDDAQRLAVRPLAWPLEPALVPGSEAWQAVSEEERSRARAAIALVANEIGEQRPVWEPRAGSKVWDVYRDILDDDVELAEPDASGTTESEARGLLFDDEGEPSAVYRRFQGHRDTVLELREQRRQAEAGSDEAARLDDELAAAEDAWAVEGRRADVEDALAALDRETGESLASRWQKERSDLEAATLTGPSELGSYLPTGVVPHRLDALDWHHVELDSDELSALAAEARERFPDLAPAGDGSIDDLGLRSLAFEAAIVRFRRDWLDLGLVESRGWRWPDDREPVADADGRGRMPAIAAGAVVVRNVEARYGAAGEDTDAVRNVGPVLLAAGDDGRHAGPRAPARELRRVAVEAAAGSASPRVSRRLAGTSGGTSGGEQQGRAKGKKGGRTRERVRARRGRGTRALRVSGRVTDTENGRPVPGARVRLVATEKSVEEETTSDGEGRFSVRTHNVGYRVWVSAEGYETAKLETEAQDEEADAEGDGGSGGRRRVRVRARRGRDADEGGGRDGATRRRHHRSGGDDEGGRRRRRRRGRGGRRRRRAGPKVRDHRPETVHVDVQLTPEVQRSEAWQLVAMIRRDLAPSPNPDPALFSEEPAGE